MDRMTQKMHFDHKIGRKIRLLLVRGRPILTGFGASLAIASNIPPVGAEMPRSEVAITCINPVSGWSWQIKIDYARSTVDSNPAHIRDTQVSWHDATDGGNYTLERNTGNLTEIVASSTGGYFLHHHCRLQN
jgi:hypothetical protein